MHDITDMTQPQFLLSLPTSCFLSLCLFHGRHGESKLGPHLETQKCIGSQKLFSDLFVVVFVVDDDSIYFPLDDVMFQVFCHKKQESKA